METTSRIGLPMTWPQARTWLMSGESPAGQCSGSRATQLLAFAQVAGACPLSWRRLDQPLTADHRVLCWDGQRFELFPAVLPDGSKPC